MRKDLAPGARAIDKGGSFGLLLTVFFLSATASILAIRLATPVTLDEKSTTALLFILIPAVLILGLGAVWRTLGLLAAAALPFAWLILSTDKNDSPYMFLIPAFCAVAVIYLSRRRSREAHQRGASFVAALALMAVFFWPMPGRPADGTRLLVIGIDGADWKIIDPLVAEGKMPNMKRLLDGGHRANLRSLVSMFSPQVWTTICTGCEPKVHGIHSFASKACNMKVGTLWDQMKLEGRSIGLCDWYFTWPPEPRIESRDFIVPSGLAPDCRTYPANYSFYRRLKELEGRREKRGARGRARAYIKVGVQAWRNGIRLSTIRRGTAEMIARVSGRLTTKEMAWRARRVSTAVEADLFAEMVRTRRPELGAVIFTAVDQVSHKFWKFMEPEGFPEVTKAQIERYRGAIPEIYIETDRAIGRILGSVPKDVDVIIVSDHGFQAITHERAEKFRRVRVLKLADELGLGGNLLGANIGKNAYLWPTSCPPASKDKLLAHAEKLLKTGYFIGQDLPLFIVEREEGQLCLRVPPNADLSRDVRVSLGGREYPMGRFISDPNRRHSGDHRPDGVYLLAGPSAAKAAATDSLHVLDIAPTIAALLDLPFCQKWSGHAALHDFSMSAVRLAEYLPSGDPDASPEDVDDALLEKLKSLGYME